MINKNINRLIYRRLTLLPKPLPFLPTKLLFTFSKQTNLQKQDAQADLDQIIPPINKPKQQDGGIYSVDRVIDRQEVSEQLKERMDKLRKKHQLLRIQLAKKIEIPFILCGVNRKTYHQSYGYLPQRVMSYYKIHPTTITDYLLKIYKASLYSIIDKNTGFMDQYWEDGVKEKVLKSLDTTKEKGYTLRILEDKTFAESMKESCRIVDALMIRGLSVNRKDNKHPSQYHRYAQDKQYGLTTFTPLYLTDDNQKFANPQTNKNIYKGYQRMVMRVLVLIKTPVRLSVDQLPIPDQLNTYEHLVVFENEMVAPPPLQSRYKLQTLVEWLGKYRFGQWRVVDIDNFMRGNSLFREHQQQQEIDQIFKNTIMDKSYYCNIRNI